MALLKPIMRSTTTNISYFLTGSKYNKKEYVPDVALATYEGKLLIDKSGKVYVSKTQQQPTILKDTSDRILAKDSNTIYVLR